MFYDKPFLKFERLMETYLALAPRGFRSFQMAMPLWLKEKLLKRELKQFAKDSRTGSPNSAEKRSLVMVSPVQ